MASPYISPRFAAVDAFGNPLVGGRLYTYANGTTTPQTTYQDAAGTIANTNPIILDARGEAVIFLQDGLTYTWVLKTATDALIWSQDGITSGGGNGSFPSYPVAPPTDVGSPIYIIGLGLATWNGTKYVPDYSGGFNGGAFDARNRLLNGGFLDWPNGTTVGPITSANSGSASAANWPVLIGGTASVTATQQTASLDYGQDRVGAFTLRLTSNAAATPAAGDRNRLIQNIQGDVLTDFGLGSLWPGSFTISFWAKASAIGDYSVAVMNSGSPTPRSYVTTFTIDAPNVEEFKTVTIPIDASGLANWNRAIGVGLQLIFDLGSGATYEGPEDVWSSLEYSRVVGSNRIVSTNGATLEVGSVQLERGSNYTPFSVGDRQKYPIRFRVGGEMSVASATTITVAPGAWRDSSNATDISLGVSITKTLQTSGAWAAGTGQNGLFSGAAATNTWYHVFAIKNLTTGAVDVGFDTSLTAANIPSGWSAYRRIGSIFNQSVGGIRPFFQSGALFRYPLPLNNLNNNSLGVPGLVTVSTPPGVRCMANLGAVLGVQSGFAAAFIFSPDETDRSTDAVANLFAGVGLISAANVHVMTSTVPQVYMRGTGPIPAGAYLNTIAYTDFIGD